MSGGLLRLDVVVNIRFPGQRAHGIQVAAMAESLAATGLVVDLVVPRRYPYREVDAWAHYGVRRTFRIHRIACLDTIDMVPARLQRLPFLVQSVTFGWRALARAAVERASGVLVRDHYTLMALVSGLRERDLPRLSAEVHDLPQDPGRRARLMTALARIPAVVAISDGLREDLEEGGVEPERILVARDGVHLERYEELPSAPDAREHLGLPRDQPTIVYAGQLYPWKGVDGLVAAVGKLPGVRLMIVGGDRINLARIKKLAEEVAPGRITLCGRQDHAVVPFHLAAGDVIALPNSGQQRISARYTSPLKLFEAMATRRPIVASSLPSLREVLTHDKTAWLVEPDDVDALAQGLAAVLDNPALGDRLAEQARCEVEPFDWSERGRNVARFLRQRLAVGAA